MNSRNKFDVAQFKAVAAPMLYSKNSVVWLRSPDYKKQIYVSKSIENVWQCSADTFYNSPAEWERSLLTHSRDQWARAALERAIPNEHQGTNLYYAIETQEDNKVKFIRDTAFYLYDTDNNKFSAVAGIAVEIPEQQWEIERSKQSSPTDASLMEFYDQLGSLHIKPPEKSVHARPKLYVGNTPIELSKRQLQCLYYLLQGYSAKQVALQLSRSVRTIETHINILKNKLNCNSKFEFFQKYDVNIVAELLESH